MLTLMTTSVEAPRTGWIADDSSFGARLALVRQRMQWGNVKEAADACGIPVESWRRWERDGRAPRDVVDQARKIADRTGADFGWLLDPRLRGRTQVTAYSKTPPVAAPHTVDVRSPRARSRSRFAQAAAA
jgi:hypothetical protein